MPAEGVLAELVPVVRAWAASIDTPRISLGCWKLWGSFGGYIPKFIPMPHGRISSLTGILHSAH